MLEFPAAEALGTDTVQVLLASPPPRQLTCAPRAAQEGGQGARLPLLVMIPWKKGSGRRGARRVSRKGVVLPPAGAGAAVRALSSFQVNPGAAERL